MTKRSLTLIALFCAIGSYTILAANTLPSEASIKQLLEAANAHKLVDTMLAQMDGYMKQIMQQATQGQNLTPDIQNDIDKRESEMMGMVKELLDWNKLEPLYIRVYQKSFTQGEVDGLTAFYKTPTGQALLTKMPIVMQNTLDEMQQMMQPMMQRMQRMQQDVVAEIEAQKRKSGG